MFLNVPAIERSPLWSSTTQQANTIRAHVKGSFYKKKKIAFFFFF